MPETTVKSDNLTSKMTNARVFGTYGLICTMPLTIGLLFGLNFHLHPYLMYASSKGFGEFAHMRRLA